MIKLIQNDFKAMGAGTLLKIYNMLSTGEICLHYIFEYQHWFSYCMDSPIKKYLKNEEKRKEFAETADFYAIENHLTGVQFYAGLIFSKAFQKMIVDDHRIVRIPFYSRKYLHYRVLPVLDKFIAMNFKSLEDFQEITNVITGHLDRNSPANKLWPPVYLYYDDSSKNKGDWFCGIPTSEIQGIDHVKYEGSIGTNPRYYDRDAGEILTELHVWMGKEMKHLQGNELLRKLHEMATIPHVTKLPEDVVDYGLLS